MQIIQATVGAFLWTKCLDGNCCLRQLYVQLHATFLLPSYPDISNRLSRCKCLIRVSCFLCTVLRICAHLARRTVHSHAWLPSKIILRIVVHLPTEKCLCHSFHRVAIHHCILNRLPRNKHHSLILLHQRSFHDSSSHHSKFLYLYHFIYRSCWSTLS